MVKFNVMKYKQVFVECRGGSLPRQIRVEGGGLWYKFGRNDRVAISPMNRGGQRMDILEG